MASVLIQPSGGKSAQRHYETSVRKPINLEDVRDTLSPELYSELLSQFPDGRMAVWGLSPGDRDRNVSKWSAIEQDDIALFSGKKRFFALAKVVSKFRNRDLAEQLWGVDDEGITWEFIYTLKEVQQIDIPYVDFNRVIGDSPRNNHMGFRILDNEKSVRFVEYLRGQGREFRDATSSIEELSAAEIIEVLEMWGDQPPSTFLRSHGLHRAQRYEIVHEGKRFDAKAVVDLALRQKFPDLEQHETTGNERTIARPLQELGFIVDDKSQTETRFWWVNQNKTREEVDQGFMWSPKTGAGGRFSQFYLNMTRTRPGDVVLSYFGSKIRAIGVVTSLPTTAAKPIFRQKDGWASEGWFVEVDFQLLPNPVSPKEHIEILAPMLPKKYSPIGTNGDGLQGVYLAEVSESLVNAILDISKFHQPDGNSLQARSRQQAHEVILNAREERNEVADQIEQGIVDSPFMGNTERQALTKSRRGQGVFRRNVMRRGPRCRVTGVGEPHLVASHIKPWANSSNQERIDGNNGLMLAPHIDHLFNDGLLSFADDGSLLVSSALKPSVLEAWGIDSSLNVGQFSIEQSRYLEYHRREIFVP